MTHEIVFMEALHEEDDTALFFVVEPAEKGVVVPVVDAAALAFGERLVGFQGIIDDDEIGTATSQNPAYRSREPKSLLRGHELLNRLLVGREPGGEQSLIPTDIMVVRQSRASLSDSSCP